MFDWIYFLAPNLKQLGGELLTCLGQTFTMIGVSGILSWILGILVGVLLVTCRPGGILENRPLFTIFDRGIDIIRSIPFIILIVLLIPLSRFLVGTGSGVTGSFVALVFGTVPFFARQIESVLSEIDHGLVEASAADHFRRLSAGKYSGHHPRDDDYLRQLCGHYGHCRRDRRGRHRRLCHPLRLSDGLPRHDLADGAHYSRHHQHLPVLWKYDHPPYHALTVSFGTCREH